MIYYQPRKLASNGFTIAIALSLFTLYPCARANEYYSVPADSHVKSIDITQAPHTVQLCNQIIKITDQCYPVIKQFLGSTASIPEKVDVVLSTSLHTAYSGSTIYLDTPWLQQHPEDIGTYVWALASVMAHYSNAPNWIITGMADHWRYIDFKMPDVFGHCGSCAGGQTYESGFGCAASFLEWIRKQQPAALNKLNTVLLSGSYTDDFWKNLTGKNLSQLWTEFSTSSDFLGSSQIQQNKSVPPPADSILSTQAASAALSARVAANQATVAANGLLALDRERANTCMSAAKVDEQAYSVQMTVVQLERDKAAGNQAGLQHDTETLRASLAAAANAARAAAGMSQGNGDKFGGQIRQVNYAAAQANLIAASLADNVLQCRADLSKSNDQAASYNAAGTTVLKAGMPVAAHLNFAAAQLINAAAIAAKIISPQSNVAPASSSTLSIGQGQLHYESTGNTPPLSGPSNSGAVDSTSLTVAELVRLMNSYEKFVGYKIASVWQQSERSVPWDKVNGEVQNPNAIPIKLGLKIDRTGTPTDVHIVLSSGSPEIDNSMLSAATSASPFTPVPESVLGNFGSVGLVISFHVRPPWLVTEKPATPLVSKAQYSSPEEQQQFEQDGTAYQAFIKERVSTAWQQTGHSVPWNKIKGKGSMLFEVHLTVDHSGTTKSIQLTKSSGIPEFDNSLLKAFALAAPFSPLPQSLMNKADLIEMLLVFKVNENSTPAGSTASIACMTAQQYYDMGIKYKRQGRCELARAALLQAVKLDNGGGISKDAQSFLDTEIPKYPVSPEAEQENIRGYNFMESGSLNAAKETFSDTIKRFPNFEWPYSNLALVYLKGLDTKQATVLLKKALEINPSYVHAWCVLSQAQMDEGNFDAAQQSINHALQLNPNEQVVQVTSSLLNIKRLEAQLKQKYAHNTPAEQI